MNDRKLAAKLAEDLLNKKIDFNTFITEYPDSDPEIFKLFDLIEHEPKVGGIFGVSKAHHDAHITEIKNLVEKL